ncbi:uncharacterized protein E0L32_004495 [Thyridium curvatum]|uniref:MICOS complex subunit MIC60 n=1 Tax=Thyridium curvatum TaxID=1093900 RepID=A0A507AXK5_9PEZI|nr:uncharacterized protein E0L32_004495 [Thyridium curvatum]TPX15515.1 hypothetical protein E0L32_004495 [Thyridium curvatum]
MLRTSLRTARALSGRPLAAAAGRQWQVAAVRPAGLISQRCYADDKKPAAIPVSETNTAAGSKPPTSEPAVAEATIPAENVPLTPPAPEVAAAATSTPPPPPPPAPKRGGFFRRLRNYVLTMTILGALAFGGGVWYSRINDNFHDFFTEYVPFGEQAVLYLEEMDFRKRFPQMANRVNRQHSTGESVKIPAQSGASWRVADHEASSRQSSAVTSNSAKVQAVKKDESKPAAKKQTPKAEEPKAKEAAPAPKVEEAPKKAAAAAAAAAAPTVATAASTPAFKAPEVDEPSRWPPASPIDPLAVNDAVEPVVQDLVRMLNDIITVINHDNANEKYGSTIGKAKNELNKVGQKIKLIKEAAEKKAAESLVGRTEAFDRAATDLVTRVEAAMVAQEAQWRQQFEEEMQKLRESYDERLKNMTAREQQVNEEKTKNRLLEQAVELNRQFAQEVKARVEQEREGRLGKLNELSSAVSELEKLTAGWNEVVSTNQRTQQLHVAVEAVRASLEDATHPRPFIKELVALKEIASDDPVVDAAIASINPASYQRGLPPTPDLIDRFRRVAGEVRKASLLPEDAGVASHASSLILSKVMFKKQGHAAGDDVESVLTRTQSLLEEGDLDGAAREMNGLKGWAKTLSRDWLGEVRKVLEVQQALDVSLFLSLSLYDYYQGV